jgi:hypothetical protein
MVRLVAALAVASLLAGCPHDFTLRGDTASPPDAGRIDAPVAPDSSTPRDCLALDSAQPDASLCSVDSWCRVAIDGFLAGVWGSSGTDVYAVGSFGAIAHFDGNSWTAAKVGRSGESLTGVWGTSASDVYIVGYEWGHHTVLHFDGKSWTRPIDEAGGALLGVWGSGADVYAVGAYGTILHFDGTSWKMQPATSDYDPRAVWGSSGSDVYAVGTNYGMGGMILHFDGTSWTMQQETPEILNGVWGSAKDDVFAVGARGTILHRDGKGWAPITSPSPVSLSSVWGSSGTDVYAVGDFGTILHHDGKSWQLQASGTSSSSLYGVWGTSTEVFVVGDNIVLRRHR